MKLVRGKQVDGEWLQLMRMARDMGLSVEEVREYILKRKELNANSGKTSRLTV